MIAVADERRDRPVRDVDERAGRLDDIQAERPRVRQRPLRRAVGGDHDALRPHLRGLVRDGDAPGAQVFQHGRVVHQVAENGERRGAGLFERQRDRVAHAEAHAQ